MSQQYINIGATPNDGLGDPIRTAFQKTNENFSELYANSGNGGNANTGNITFSNVTIGTQNLNPVIIQTNANGRLSSWNFNSTGTLSFPDSGLIDDNGGIFRVKSNANAVQLGSPDDQNYVNVDNSSVTIQVNSDGNIGPHALPQHNWIFDNAGNLTAPGNISADGLYAGNVLAGGSYFYANSNGTSFGIVAAGGVQVDTGGIYIASTGGVNIYGVAGAQVYLGGGTSGNITVRSAINSNSTITATTYYGNGSQLTSLPAPTVTYDNTSTGYMDLMTYDGTIKYVSQATVEPSSGNIHTVGNISAVGNINSNYIFGNGTFLTGISGAGNPSANALTGNTLTANVIISSLTQLGTLGNLSVSGNTTSGNLLTSGIISVTGNAIAGNILTAGVISSTGNAVHGNILTAGLISSTGNAIAGNILTGGFVSATGNIIATNFIGNLSNGNSKISIASSGNITVGIGPFDTTVLNINTSTGISVLGNVVASQAISAVGNVYSNGNIAMVSNLPRNTYVANVAPTVGQGNIGDIWYQTF